MKNVMIAFSLLLLLAGCGTTAQQSSAPEKAKAATSTSTKTAPQKKTTSTKSTKSKTSKTSAPKKPSSKTPSKKSDSKKTATKSSAKTTKKSSTPVKKKTVKPTITKLASTKTFYISVSSAYIHKGPGLSSPNLLVLNKATKLTAHESTKIDNRTWYEVTFNSGKQGWVSSAVLSSTKPATPPKPVVATKKTPTKSTSSTPAPKPATSYVDKLLAKARTRYNSSEAMIVTAQSAYSYHATLTAYSYRSGKWVKAYSMPAAIGKYGITFNMHEGGMKSPAGIYYIGRAFGEMPKPSGVSLSYTQTTSHDYWIDDPTSSDYNQWEVYSGNPYNKWKSFERLRIPQYKYAAVIEYNTHPIVKGKGSAIFLHVWSGPYSPTAGCTAVAEGNMVTLLRWMNPSLHPTIIQGTVSQLQALSK